jgi:hypothetical protein
MVSDDKVGPEDDAVLCTSDKTYNKHPISDPLKLRSLAVSWAMEARTECSFKIASMNCWSSYRLYESCIG